MINVFENAPEFISNDLRVGRGSAPVSAESMLGRCETFLPAKNIEGKTILDIGCYMGAMGHWALSNGAKYYTGYEAQHKMAGLADSMLSKYWQPNQFLIKNEYFKNSDNQRYDIVIVIGVLYNMSNIIEFIDNICDCCDEIIIDSMTPYADYNDRPVIEIVDGQMQSSDEAGVYYYGVGLRPTPSAIITLMEKNGFGKFTKIVPPVNKVGHNAYSDLVIKNHRPLQPSRFAYRFIRTHNKEEYSLEKTLLADDKKRSKVVNYFSDTNNIHAESWEFNKDVAEKFKEEARKHIPDYRLVIDLCMRETLSNYPDKKTTKIIDVGSALGYTVDSFIMYGYDFVRGVESSQDMIKKSEHIDKIYCSESFPENDWDIVIANWVLHFMKDREEYLKSIYTNMSSGGMFILTDKMNSTPDIINEYYNFKIDNGVSEEEITIKSKALSGVLITKDLSWYISILEKIGFKNIEIIHSRYMFNTIKCIKG